MAISMLLRNVIRLFCFLVLCISLSPSVNADDSECKPKPNRNFFRGVIGMELSSPSVTGFETWQIRYVSWQFERNESLPEIQNNSYKHNSFLNTTVLVTDDLTGGASWRFNGFTDRENIRFVAHQRCVFMITKNGIIASNSYENVELTEHCEPQKTTVWTEEGNFYVYCNGKKAFVSSNTIFSQTTLDRNKPTQKRISEQCSSVGCIVSSTKINRRDDYKVLPLLDNGVPYMNYDDVLVQTTSAVEGQSENIIIRALSQKKTCASFEPVKPKIPKNFLVYFPDFSTRLTNDVYKFFFDPTTTSSTTSTTTVATTTTKEAPLRPPTRSTEPPVETSSHDYIEDEGASGAFELAPMMGLLACSYLILAQLL